MKDIFLFLATLLINYLAVSCFEKQKQVANNDEIALRDIGHLYLPHFKKNAFSDIVPIIVGSLSLILVRDNRDVILPSLSVLYILRIIAYNLTVLPTSNKKCDIKNKNIGEGCHDKIFSGHTGFVVLLCLFISERYPKFSIPGVLLSILQMFLSVATRAHYSVDVYIGTLVAFLIYNYRMNFKI